MTFGGSGGGACKPSRSAGIAVLTGDIRARPNPRSRYVSAGGRSVAGRSPAMTYLYSLYDALVAINVPFDKARAVVDAMERDMGTTLATKEDLRVLRIELTQEVALVRKDLENLNDAITLRLGSIVVIALGVLFAALKLTG
jgi:hypothetical protein